jgi:hypothetical protein
VRAKIVFLPDIALQQPWMIWTAIQNVGRGQAVAFELPVEVLSLTLADLRSVGEGIFHAQPDMAWNFDTVSARP